MIANFELASVACLLFLGDVSLAPLGGIARGCCLASCLTSTRCILLDSIYLC